MGIEFRYAERKDLTRIVEIYNQSIKLKNITADINPITVSERENWFENASPDKYPIWVIISESEIIGWFSLEAFYGRDAYQHTAEVSIYLDETARGQHLGTKVLEFLKTKLSKLSLTSLVAYIFKQNDPSINLFTKQGFEIWGLLPQVAQIDGAYLDLAILGKQFI